MDTYYLGIDLGTSAVKVLGVSPNGEHVLTKSRYTTADPDGWCAALQHALQEMWEMVDPKCIAAVSVSSQVGTYLTDDGHVIAWNSDIGRAEWDEIKPQVTSRVFQEEIGMMHPDLISYPLPRLLYIKRHMPQCKSVCMPKEMLLHELTGKSVTDIFSQRGICHPERKAYSARLLAQFQLTDIALPPIKQPTDLAGTVTAEAAEKYGLRVNTPVYVGCNDFFAGLLGLGAYEQGTVFELSGTSEHLGVITARPMDGCLVSGPYFNGCVTYGGTKASGTVCDRAMAMFGIDAVTTETVYRAPPIFLPYLKGERAPIFSEDAKGVFFGMTDRTTATDMAYAMLEGVVFSLYHIAKTLGLDSVPVLRMGGGSAVDSRMAQMKAALWNGTVLAANESNCSALGAAMIAMVGSGYCPTFQDAIAHMVSYTEAALPSPKLRNILLKRFSIYENLYPNLTEQFAAFSQL